MRVMYLVDRPAEDVAQVAEWFMERWGPDSVEHWLPLVGGMLQRSTLPTTFVAVEGEELLGTASLVGAGPGGLHWSPWLASLYVRPEARQQGVAAALLRRVELEARLLGFPRLYFAAAGPAGPYESMGWQWVGCTRTSQGLANVLMLDLAARVQAA